MEWNIAHANFPKLYPCGNTKMDDLMLHEFCHETANSHYGPEILDAATKLGAKFKSLAIKKPQLFTSEWLGRAFN